MQLAGFGVDRIGLQLAGVAAKERIGERAIAPIEPGQVQAHEQAGHRVEQPLAVALEALVHEERAVGQGAVEVARDEHAVVFACAGGAHPRVASRDHRRQPPVLHSTQQRILALRQSRRQFLERVDRVLILDEEHLVA